MEEVTHCFTRLRFVLKDESIPRDGEVSRAEGRHLRGQSGRAVPGGLRHKGAGFARNWKKC